MSAPSTAAPKITDSGAQTFAPYPPADLLKGAMIAAVRGSAASQPSIVPFQYNPSTLSRTLSPSYYEGSSERFTGPAKQSIDVTVQLEASGSREAATGDGVLAYLAALELMIQPSSDDLDAYVQDTKSNKMKAVPPLAPRSLFVWGPSRVLPVRLTSMTVTEKLFGPNLSPVLAEVALKMEIYPFNEASDKDYQLILTNLKMLEKLRGDVPTSGVDIGVTNAASL
jgi:hypothetical protein